MTLSTDITLPANIQPVFPCRCVVCGEESSDTAKISADAQGFIVSFFVPLMSLLGRKKIEFPICPECKPRFFRQRWIRSLICWSIIIVVVFVALPYFQGWNRSVTKLAVLGIGIAAVVPQLIFEVFFPRWFDITASKETVDYEFKSEDYATDFYVLNREAFPDVEILVDNELVNSADEIAD